MAGEIYREWSNDQWVQGVAQGNTAVLAGVHAFLIDQIHWLPLSSAGIDEQLVEQAIGPAYEKIVRKVGQFRGECKFTSWMRTILVRECRMIVRSRGGDDEAPIDPDPPDRSGSPQPRLPRAPEPTPKSIHPEILEALGACLAGLSPEERAFVEEAPLPGDGYSLAEFCREQGQRQARVVVERTMRRHYSKLMKRLLDCLEGKGVRSLRRIPAQLDEPQT